MRWITLLLTLIMGCADMPPSGHFKDGVIDYAGSNTSEWISNLGLSYSGGVLTVTDAQGSTLTPENPGWVTTADVQSSSSNKFVNIKVMASLFFNDDSNASSHMTSRGFGITEANPWANSIPFFIYLVNKSNTSVTGNDGDSTLAIGRSPWLHTTPGPAGVGDLSTIAAADSEASIMLMDNLTGANYVTTLPMQLIGWFAMQWSSVNQDWTVQGVNSAFYGIGGTALRHLEEFEFEMPLAQNGASAGTYFLPNGGTAPVFTTNAYLYKLGLNRIMYISILADGDGGADGAVGGTARIALPLSSDGTDAINQIVGVGYLQAAGIAAGAINLGVLRATSGFPYMRLETAASVIVNNVDFSAGARTVNFQGYLRI